MKGWDVDLLGRRLLASTVTVNLSVALGALLMPTHWREASLVICFILAHGRRSCPGMLVAGLQFAVVPPLRYSLLYVTGMTSTLYSIWFQFDLMLFNALCLQVPCYLLTENTAHAWMCGLRSFRVCRKELKLAG